MIEKIVLGKINDLDERSRRIEIEFGKKTNVIIGPKGGGKSTLFDLLAGLKNKVIYQNVVEALESFGLEFLEAYKFSGEVISARILAHRAAKTRLQDYGQRHDIIYQQDPIKENLHNSKEITKKKERFARDVVSRAPTVDNLIRQTSAFYHGMEGLKSLDDKVLNWANLFKLKSQQKDASDLILKLNYDPQFQIAKLDRQNAMLKKASEASQEYQRDTLLKLKNNLDDLDQISEQNRQNLKNQLLKLEEHFKVLSQFFTEQINWLSRVKKVLTLFYRAYQAVVEEMKIKSFEKAGLKDFRIKAETHFRKYAELTRTQQQLFRDLLVNPVRLDFNQAQEGAHFLAFEIKKTVELTEPQVYTLLSQVLYKPGSDNDIGGWLKTAIEKGLKEFEPEKIRRKLVQIVKEQVSVLANGKNYETMSLGEKSIYGIKYKLLESADQPLFLDQPEDNLDNHTIAESVLKLINEHQQQIFMVTHNANLGILSRPEKVILANLHDPDERPYREGRWVVSDESTVDGTLYLEGGSQFLEKRYQIVKGKNYDN